MNRAGFAYAQARLHARLDGRFTEADWRMLASSRDFGNCLEVVNQTAAAHITSRMDRTNNVHTVERVLREEWGVTVIEIAQWLPKKWRQALRWMTVLPHLRRFEYSPDKADIPRWLRLTTEFGKDTNLLRPGGGTNPTTVEVAEIWQNEWRLRLPSKQYATELESALMPLLDRYLCNGSPEAVGASKAWQNLTSTLKGLFRNQPQTPVAIFAYIGLIALDFERLRGGLVDRIIFSESFNRGEV